MEPVFTKEQVNDFISDQPARDALTRVALYVLTLSADQLKTATIKKESLDDLLAAVQSAVKNLELIYELALTAEKRLHSITKGNLADALRAVPPMPDDFMGERV